MAADLKLTPIKGVRVSTGSAGLYNRPRSDLTLIVFDSGATVAATFTQNDFCAAPVTVARQHLEVGGGKRAWLINAGNANAGNGLAGSEVARRLCGEVAKCLKIEAKDVLPFSTGVIGEPLDADKVVAKLPELSAELESDNWQAATTAIMTTDTVLKGFSRVVELDGGSVQITGIGKGSGMIHPNMATMLAFIATDADVAQSVLHKCLTDAVSNTFNCISVDGDTSTNDACALVATGRAGNTRIENSESKEYLEFCAGVRDVCSQLARSIVMDGEGATKFVSVSVGQCRSVSEARSVANAIARSPLVKTACFASDPNWGRVMAAVGNSGIEDLDIGGVSIFLGSTCIVSSGARASDYQEKDGKVAMQGREIEINVLLSRGKESSTVWTTDLSHEYIRINAEYRT